MYKTLPNVYLPCVKWVNRDLKKQNISVHVKNLPSL